MVEAAHAHEIVEHEGHSNKQVLITNSTRLRFPVPLGAWEIGDRYIG